VGLAVVAVEAVAVAVAVINSPKSPFFYDFIKLCLHVLLISNDMLNNRMGGSQRVDDDCCLYCTV
jgi:hypothetical protein